MARLLFSLLLGGTVWALSLHVQAEFPKYPRAGWAHQIHEYPHDAKHLVTRYLERAAEAEGDVPELVRLFEKEQAETGALQAGCFTKLQGYEKQVIHIESLPADKQEPAVLQYFQYLVYESQKEADACLEAHLAAYSGTRESMEPAKRAERAAAGQANLAKWLAEQ